MVARGRGHTELSFSLDGIGLHYSLVDVARTIPTLDEIDSSSAVEQPPMKTLATQTY